MVEEHGVHAFLVEFTNPKGTKFCCHGIFIDADDECDYDGASVTLDHGISMEA